MSILKGIKKRQVGILFIALLAATVFYVRKSALFEIKKITVRAETSEIKIAVEKSLKKLMGENLFEVELAAVSNELTSSISAIQSAVVSRQLPATLLLKITERKGVALKFTEKGFAVLDSEGVAFKETSESLPLFWPLPSDLKTQKEILSWFDLEIKTSKLKDVNGLTWDNNLGLILETKTRTRVILGKNNFADNWKKAKESLQYVKSRGIQARRIDATYNARAVISL